MSFYTRMNTVLLAAGICIVLFPVCSWLILPVQAHTGTFITVYGVLTLTGCGFIAAGLYQLHAGFSRPLEKLNAYTAALRDSPATVTPQLAGAAELHALAEEIHRTTTTLVQNADSYSPAAQAAGTLSEKFEQSTREAQAYRTDVEIMLSSLHKATQKAGDISGELTGSLRTVTADIDHVTGGISVQNSKTQQIAIAMNEMNTAVLEVARNAASAASQAARSQEKAQAGSREVHKALELINDVEENIGALKTTMDELGAQAESIGVVLNVINDIADQTNLLALNAAIESARAGEAGRGFAVVADEVRKLAEKTVSATKEVNEVVHGIRRVARNSMDAVDEAAGKIGHSATAAADSERYMTDLIDIISQASYMVQNMAAASEEQSATSDQINAAIAGIKDTAEETTAGMTRSAEALARITGLIAELESILAALAKAETGKTVSTGDGQFLNWTDDLSVNIGHLDSQHKNLVALINELAAAMKAGKAKSVMLDTLGRLKEYTLTHFKEEEDLFDRYDVPGSRDHKKIHQSLREKVLSVEQDIVSGRITVSLELLEFLKEWILNHIQVVDKQYSAFLNSKGVR